jgi:hypothetical protein
VPVPGKSDYRTSGFPAQERATKLLVSEEGLYGFMRGGGRVAPPGGSAASILT